MTRMESIVDSIDPEDQQSAYFTTRREPRLLSSSQKRRGPRSSYVGTEVFAVGIVKSKVK